VADKTIKLHWFLVKAKPRIFYSIVVGVLAFILLKDYEPTIRFLMGWSAASITYLVLVFLMMHFVGNNNISKFSALEDDGKLAIYIISLLSGVVSLLAIFIHIGGMKDVPRNLKELAVLMTGVTFFTSWLVLHTAYCLHYAHVYYLEQKKNKKLSPLVFSGSKNPSYADFFHFSMVIGMTCQTADVVIQSSKIRSLITVHSMISFAFNATLLALTMSLVAGLMS
jgi:uncharacterized membrane protein